ncbi:hypothetical protein XI08_29480 [Bradyrhizobium sp. CCBAU 11361]|nr:hypothetical protein [Bradyrhizobium sp. CCBAU 11361]
MFTLTARRAAPQTKEAPPFGGARPHSLLLTRNCSLSSQLVVLTVLATLLAGAATLAHRVILPLLSGFLPAALLLPWLLTWLLTWALLTGVLTLLTRILVLLLRHRGELPCWTSEGK